MGAEKAGSGESPRHREISAQHTLVKLIVERREPRIQHPSGERWAKIQKGLRWRWKCSGCEVVNRCKKSVERGKVPGLPLIEV